MNNSPQFFEQLIVDLVVAMGYGGSVADAGKENPVMAELMGLLKKTFSVWTKFIYKANAGATRYHALTSKHLLAALLGLKRIKESSLQLLALQKKPLITQKVSTNR